MQTSAARRRRRWPAIVGLALVVVVSAAFTALRVAFEGPALGDNIASILNKRMRGRIEIGSIEWPAAALEKVVTGGWVPLTIRDVRVWDDCALSAVSTDDHALRIGDPNQECSPDDRPVPASERGRSSDKSSHKKPRKLLVRTDLVTVELDAHALMFGNHDLVFRHLWIYGGEALLEQTREPYPLTDYDHTVLSIVSAFLPRMTAAFRAGIYADAPPPLFDLRDVHISGLNLTLHMAPAPDTAGDDVRYAFTARLTGVDVDTGTSPDASIQARPDPANHSYLYVDNTDPVVGKFYVRLAVAAQRATVRILDRGPRAAFRLPAASNEVFPPAGRTAAYQLALTDIRLGRLAQLPGDWARHDFVANTLDIDLTARTEPCPSGGAGVAGDNANAAALLHLSGELFNYYDRPYGGAWNLKLDAKNLGPTLRTCIAPTLGGDQLDGAVSLTGPFVAPPAIGVDLAGVDLNVPIRKDQALDLTIAELHGKIDLVNEEGYIEQTKAVVRGKRDTDAPGEVALSATFALNPYRGNADIEITRPIDLAQVMPQQVARPLGTFLQGRLRASVATPCVRGPASAESAGPTAGPDAVNRTCIDFGDFDLGLGTTPRERDIRVYHGAISSDDLFGSVQISSVYVRAGASLAEVNGRVDLAHNDMNVEITGNFPDVDVWLKRFGLPALFKSAGNGGGITLTGPPSNPRVTVTDTVLAGVPCIDKLKVGRMVRADNTITISQMTTPGLGGELSGSGTIRLGAVPTVERLELTGARLDASKVCGLKGLVKGTIDEVNVSFKGEINPRRSAVDYLGLGQVYARADHLTILDDKFSAITACLNRKDDRACRPRPALVKPDDLEQCDAGKRASAAGGSGFCLAASASRDAGGTLDTTLVQLPGRSAARGAAPIHLGGTLVLSDLPLALIDQISAPLRVAARPGNAGAFDQLRGKPAAHTVGGLASITLHLLGAPAAPQATGSIQILRSWLESGFIGDAQIDVAPTTVRGVPGLAFSGKAFDGRLAITGSLGTAAPFPVELTISGRRVEVDPFVDFKALLGIDDPLQIWASGSITLRTELLPTRPIQPEAWIELTELVAQLDHRASDGRVTPLVVRIKDQGGKPTAGRPAMSIYVTPSSLELACRDARAPGGRSECSTTLETPAGDIVLGGRAAQKAIAITASGNLDLAKIYPLIEQRFDQVAGRVRLDAAVAGALDHLKLEASLDLDPDQVWEANEAEREARRNATRTKTKRAPLPLRPENPVRLRPTGSDTVLTAPRGLIKLAYGSIGFTNVLVQIKDKDERGDADVGELHLAGNIGLAGLTPTSWSMLLSGKLPGRLLQAFAPKLVSQANGLVAIDDDDALVLSGTGPTPSVSGTLKFAHFAVVPRGGRRELTFDSGSLEITTETTGDHRLYTLEIAGVNGTLDDGRLSNIAGRLRLGNGELVSASLSFDATGIPYRIPQTLDLAISANDIHITLASPGSSWKVSGTITVLDGAYLRNFELTDRIQTIGVNTAASVPFWEEYPALGSALLDLDLHVQLFAVRDNIANIEFRSDAMQITGTPRDPRLSGEIRVTHGQFRIPYTRAEFIRTSGSVDFVQNQKASRPELHVTSEADYRDLSGQDHVITVTIGGSLEQPTWDLTTSTGYNKSQTLTLLFFGRNSEQLRRSLGDANVGSDPTRIDPTTNPSQGFADQVVKDLAGDWVSGLLGSSLTKLTGLDVLRIEIGFGSIGFHVEKKVLENAKLYGDFEQTIRGTTIKGTAELKTPFVVSLQGGYLNQNYYDPAEQDIKDYNVKLVYRVFIP